MYSFYMQKVRPCIVEEALVSGNKPIPDAQITASSELFDSTAARMARINNIDGRGGWRCILAEITAPEPRMYLQVCEFHIIY